MRILKYFEPKTAVETLSDKGLLYDNDTQTGTIVHILGGLKPCGYVEITR
ncbi:peptide ligase PGM1-related protein [Brasilonema bromeliae]